MSRQKLIERLKKKNPKLNQSDLDKLLDIFLSSIENALKEGRNVELRGFGTFFIKKIKEKYNARNPLTNELIYVPKKNKVRFKASKKLKKFINER